MAEQMEYSSVAPLAVLSDWLAAVQSALSTVEHLVDKSVCSWAALLAATSVL